MKTVVIEPINLVLYGPLLSCILHSNCTIETVPYVTNCMKLSYVFLSSLTSTCVQFRMMLFYFILFF